MLEPGFHPQLDLLYEDLKGARLEWGFEKLDITDIFFKKEDANLVFTSRCFQPNAAGFDESFKFVGPSIAPRTDIFDFPPEEIEKGTVIYISMGTINNGCIDFYLKCIEAFKESKYKIIMSVGNKADIGQLGEIPHNFIVRKHVPQLEVLKKTDVFISHGGLNSVSEALYYGVPVIAIPQANDQPMVARQLVNLGAGLYLDMANVTAELLRDTVSEMVSDCSYKKNSRDLGKSFIQAGGYMAAAEYIIGKGTINNR
jgi:MGT family glycosyltransferase